MQLLLVRHAEPDYSVDSLTEKGRREAELLAGRIAALDAEVEAYYVSPLGRARATADYTLKKVGRTAEILPWLQEFRGAVLDPDRGTLHCCWDWQPRRWQGQPELRDPDRFLYAPILRGSNVAEIWQETREGADALLARHGFTHCGPVWRCEHNRAGKIVCFCHFGIAAAIVAHLTGLSPVVLWQTACMLPSSVTTLVTEERIPGEVIWRCTGFGDISHLWAAGEAPSTAGMFAEVYDGIDTTEARG